MARKKKGRLSRKKNSGLSAKKTHDGMSAQKFDKLARNYLSFIIEDANHDQKTFAKDDVAYIRYQDLEDDVAIPEKDCWIGVIQEIRADNPDDVWVRVRWFWSPQEVAEVIKSFDPTICGRYEKLFSDNHDIISAHCFVSHVDVKRFDENSISQVPIGDDEWFFRYELLYVSKRITPKVAHIACPICKGPYTPGTQKTMHFCPRPGCRKFYHQSCLVKGGYVNKVGTPPVLETWPSVDRTVSVEALWGMCSEKSRSKEEPSPPRKRQKRDHLPPKEGGASPLELAGLPPMLVAVAGQRIVRGLSGGGIVGNIAAVTAARQLIFEVLTRRGTIPDDWETAIDVSSAFLETDGFPNCTCPNCYSAI